MIFLFNNPIPRAILNGFLIEYQYKYLIKSCKSWPHWSDVQERLLKENSYKTKKQH